MKKIWKQKLDELDAIIREVPVGRDGRIMQLMEKREALERAFGEVRG